MADQSSLQNILKNTWPTLFKDIKNKKLLRNGHSLEEPKETWQVNVTWDLGWGPGTETGQGRQVKSIDFSQ